MAIYFTTTMRGFPTRRLSTKLRIDSSIYIYRLLSPSSTRSNQWVSRQALFGSLFRQFLMVVDQYRIDKKGLNLDGVAIKVWTSLWKQESSSITSILNIKLTNKSNNGSVGDDTLIRWRMPQESWRGGCPSYISNL